jgi:hypothetical protein
MVHRTLTCWQRQNGRPGPAEPKEFIMQTIRHLAALAVAFGMSGSAFAASPTSLKPIQSQSIDLGSVAGDAYYTVEGNGYHVVATFAQHGANAVPVRFEAVLSRGQSIRFSTPGAAGATSNTVEIIRQNSGVTVQRPAS